MEGAQIDVINAVLRMGTPFISTLKLIRFDTRDECVSAPALGAYISSSGVIVTPRFLLSLMPCGPLYDAVSNHRSLLNRVYFRDCIVEVSFVADPYPTQAHTGAVRLIGTMRRAPHLSIESVGDMIFIYSHFKDWLKCLSLEDFSDIRRLNELYGDQLNMFDPPPEACGPTRSGTNGS